MALHDVAGAPDEKLSVLSLISKNAAHDAAKRARIDRLGDISIATRQARRFSVASHRAGREGDVIEHQVRGHGDDGDGCLTVRCGDVADVVSLVGVAGSPMARRQDVVTHLE